MKELNKNETVTSPTLSNNSEKNLTEAELQVSFPNYGPKFENDMYSYEILIINGY